MSKLRGSSSEAAGTAHKKVSMSFPIENGEKFSPPRLRSCFVFSPTPGENEGEGNNRTNPSFTGMGTGLETRERLSVKKKTLTVPGGGRVNI